MSATQPSDNASHPSVSYRQAFRNVEFSFTDTQDASPELEAFLPMGGLNTLRILPSHHEDDGLHVEVERQCQMLRDNWRPVRMMAIDRAVETDMQAFNPEQAHMRHTVTWQEDPLVSEEAAMKVVSYQQIGEAQPTPSDLQDRLLSRQSRDNRLRAPTWQDHLLASTISDDKYSAFSRKSRKPLNRVFEQVQQYMSRHQGPLTQSDAVEWLSLMNVGVDDPDSESLHEQDGLMRWKNRADCAHELWSSRPLLEFQSILYRPGRYSYKDEKTGENVHPDVYKLWLATSGTQEIVKRNLELESATCPDQVSSEAVSREVDRLKEEGASTLLSMLGEHPEGASIAKTIKADLAESRLQDTAGILIPYMIDSLFNGTGLEIMDVLADAVGMSDKSRNSPTWQGLGWALMSHRLANRGMMDLAGTKAISVDAVLLLGEMNDPLSAAAGVELSYPRHEIGQATHDTDMNPIFRGQMIFNVPYSQNLTAASHGQGASGTTSDAAE